jgi:hypothetical protein
MTLSNERPLQADLVPPEEMRCSRLATQQVAAQVDSVMLSGAKHVLAPFNPSQTLPAIALKVCFVAA